MKTNKILVTGGAGYIGSFMVRRLRDEGYGVVILDNMSSGHKESVADFDLQILDLTSDLEKIDLLFKKEKFDAVIHMASFIQMGESFVDPQKYYFNNVYGFLNLLKVMKDNNCKKIILSSSAGVYGNPVQLPIEESDPKNPLNPYGETKYMMERILKDYDSAYKIKYVSLRYFNAAGASLDGLLGEAHPEESHLIPNIIKKALNNEEIVIFGDDYKTDDGTCVRDYIHVLDLVDAHALALSFLDENNSDVFNLGLGRGFSNKEVLNMVSKVTGLKLNVKYGPRRLGDADKLFSSNKKAKERLNWNPKYTLEDIISSAYNWHKKPSH